MDDARALGVVGSHRLARHEQASTEVMGFPGRLP
jgi:hypothetical protein